MIWLKARESDHQCRNRLITNQWTCMRSRVIVSPMLGMPLWYQGLHRLMGSDPGSRRPSILSPISNCLVIHSKPILHRPIRPKAEEVYRLHKDNYWKLSRFSEVNPPIPKDPSWNQEAHKDPKPIPTRVEGSTQSHPWRMSDRCSLTRRSLTS